MPPEHETKPAFEPRKQNKNHPFRRRVYPRLANDLDDSLHVITESSFSGHAPVRD